MRLGLGFSLSGPQVILDSGPPSSNTNLSTFTVDDVPVSDGATVDKSNGTDAVSVVATPSNGSATVGYISGATGLVTGDNPVSFTVTAADMVTTRTYTLTIHVLSVQLPEITQIVTVADVDGNLHGTNFNIYNASGLANVIINNGAQPQIITVDFTGLTGVNFVTGADGLYLFLNVPATGDLPNGQGGVWFNTGTESSPSATNSSDSSIECDVSPTDASGDLASKFAATSFGGRFSGTASGNIATLTGAVSGPATGSFGGSNSGNSGTTVVVTRLGRNAASSNVTVNSSDNADANTVAAALVTAMNGNGWSVSASSNTVTVTDSSGGTRTPASDVNTGFTITEVQAGTSPPP